MEAKSQHQIWFSEIVGKHYEEIELKEKFVEKSVEFVDRLVEG